MNSDSPSNLKWTFNSEIMRILKWVDADKLTINFLKSNIIIVPSKINRPVDDSITVTISSTPVTMVKEAKYLKIIVDNKLTFGPHIAHLEVKLSRSIGILSKLNYFYLRPYFENYTMHFFIYRIYSCISRVSGTRF